MIKQSIESKITAVENQIHTLEETESTINNSQLREGIGEILVPRFYFLQIKI